MLDIIFHEEIIYEYIFQLYSKTIFIPSDNNFFLSYK